jgi:MerR family transcriptional regulator/heat shock protein HspR
MEMMEQEMMELRSALSRMRASNGVPPEKSLVTKRSIYEMVIFDDDLLK